YSQYTALFALDPSGEILIWVGAEHALLPEFRKELAAITQPTVSPAHGEGRAFVQVAATPVEGPGRLSLHALIELSAVEALLTGADVSTSGTVFVADRGGRILMGAAPGSTGRYSRPAPSPDATAVVTDYTRSDGEHVIGSARRFGRFGWTIAIERPYDEAFAPVVTVTRELLAFNLAIVGVFSVLAFWAARSLVGPILALSEGALRIAGGNTDVEIPGRKRDDEIGVLTRAFHEMMVRLRGNQEELDAQRIEIEEANHRLVAQNQELQRVNEVFEQLSITDDLTKLHNHRFFQDHLPQEMKRADRTGEPLSLILIDIDDFKKLNDEYGHSVGDAVLRRVADVMSSQVRDMDLLARYGGEEFALLASHTDLEGAVELAEKLRVAVSQANFSLVALEGPTSVGVTVSSGVTTYKGDARAFFNEADRALYRAKDAGKDCVVASDGSAQPSRKRDA
ncbi:MAG: diguanylate cyclase, partial [Myxococcota bacterium]